jgi:hypothetical protein
MPKIKTDLSDMDEAEILAYSGNVVTQSTGNATFTSIATRITAIGTGRTAYQTAINAYEAAKQAAATLLTQRDNARAALENDMRTGASAAEGITPALSAADFQGGGWQVRGTPTPVGPMPKPANLAATLGDLDGEVDLSWNAISRGVQTYLAEYATTPTGPWTQFYVGAASKCTATGLTSGTAYWFRVRAVGAAGPGPWSDPATERAR